MVVAWSILERTHSVVRHSSTIACASPSSVSALALLATAWLRRAAFPFLLMVVGERDGRAAVPLRTCAAARRFGMEDAAGDACAGRRAILGILSWLGVSGAPPLQNPLLRAAGRTYHAALTAPVTTLHYLRISTVRDGWRW